jgi:hypothetical protein
MYAFAFSSMFCLSFISHGVVRYNTLGGVVGISIGCLLGMFPLLFIKNDKGQFVKGGGGSGGADGGLCVEASGADVSSQAAAA